jgi:hypothetical protein
VTRWVNTNLNLRPSPVGDRPFPNFLCNHWNLLKYKNISLGRFAGRDLPVFFKPPHLKKNTVFADKMMENPHCAGTMENNQAS